MAQFAMSLSDQIDRYLLSLVTMRSPQTLAWYRKRLAPLRQLSEPVTLSDLQALYAALASRNVKYADHPSGRHAESGPLSPATLRGAAGVLLIAVRFPNLLAQIVLRIA